MLPVVVVKFGRQRLHFSCVNFIVSAGNLVMVMYQVNVDLLSTNLLLHIVMRLIHVHLQPSHHFQSDH